MVKIVGKIVLYNMIKLKLLTLILMISFFSCEAQKHQKLLSDKHYQWLLSQSKRQLDGCIRQAHDGTFLYTPDGTGQYDALWTRDFSYMVENAYDLILQHHIRAAILYLLTGQREDGCIPDRVYADGMAVYSAGPVGKPLGGSPTDNSQFIVKLVADYVEKSGVLEFFQTTCGQLISAMNFVHRSKNGLVYIDPENPHSPYGFTDTIAKTGDLLFSSLLYWEACQRLTRLFEKIGDHTSAQDFKARAELIETNLDLLWDTESEMFLAASIDCQQIDIWGNAYAIYIGFPLDTKKQSIVKYLAEHFDNYVMRGQIRHLPQPEHWEKTLMPVEPETYQNGAYWGTASGWVACALSEQYSDLSRKIFKDLILDYQARGVFECINTNYSKIQNYVVSVVNPLGAIKYIL